MAEASNTRTMSFGIIAAVVIILLSGYIMDEMAGTYGLSRNGTFQTFYNSTKITLDAEYSNQTLTAGNTLNKETITSTGTDAEIFSTVWSTVKNPFQFVTAAMSLMSDVVEFIPIEDWLFKAIVTSILTLIIWLVVSSVIRKDQ